MSEFYFEIHYVIYRFFRRRKEDRFGSMLLACGVHWCLFIIFLTIVDGTIQRQFGLSEPFIKGKAQGIVYLIIWGIIEYFVFFREERYLDVFKEYDQQSDNPDMKKRLNRARLFNCIVLVIDFIGLYIFNKLNAA